MVQFPKLLSRFAADRRGNFALMTAILVVPLLGGVAMGVDYADMTRQCQTVQSALDASGIATAKRLIAGASDSEVKAYAKTFFKANLSGFNGDGAALDAVMPDDNTNVGVLKLTARLGYVPKLMGVFAKLIGRSGSDSFSCGATTEVRLKNTVEVALVLDNSGSMEFTGKNSTKKRMDLLKTAAKELIDSMAAQAKMMTQVSEPVRFSVVPFAASVNVGPDNASAAWMDTTGLSPVQSETIDWKSLAASQGESWKVEQIGTVWYGRGASWAPFGLQDKPLTRFSLFNKLIRRSTGVDGKGNATTAPFTSWTGCVETRPYPLNLDDATPISSNGATLFVPMFAPDENDPILYGNRTYPSVNDWWSDDYDDNYTEASTVAEFQRRQRDLSKFVKPYPQNGTLPTAYDGPNDSCTTKPITPLTDVTSGAGATNIKKAIDAMVPNGATNVPEGLAWGWRTLSSTAPFTEGRSEVEKGNDKVVIVLTDGANTYYTPSSLGYYDAAQNLSTYSSFGYAAVKQDNGATRLFRDPATTYSKTDYSNANYTKAMNAQFSTLCKNSVFVRETTDSSGKKTRSGKITVMTIALDLNENDAEEKTQIATLRACASPSKNTAGKILFWNATGATLSIVFKDIANELSNLRIIG